MSENPTGFVVSLMAGGVAGTAVDVSLFPLDTVKTRLQSSQGFWKAGAFRGIYSGLGPAALGSAPNAALFFCTYEAIKNLLFSYGPQGYDPLVYMAAASSGEVAACLVRVPVEVVKQRAQANRNLASLQILRNTLTQEGFMGLYRGYFATVMREIPFSVIQFPIWELEKIVWSRKQGRTVDSWQSAICGAFAGGFSAGITTPLDVAKTRIMLAKHGTSAASGRIPTVLKQIYRENGFPGLYAGIVPRVTWISLGGFVFFGMYEKSKSLIQQLV